MVEYILIAPTGSLYAMSHYYKMYNNKFSQIFTQLKIPLCHEGNSGQLAQQTNKCSP